MSDHEWRFLDLSGRPVSYFFALEDALRLAATPESRPVFMLYTPNSSVSVSKYQRLDDVNLDYAILNGIDVTRRRTGGMANYHNPSTDFSWSFILNREQFGIPHKGTRKGYEITAGIMCDILGSLGVRTKYHGSSIDTPIGRITSFAQAQGKQSVLVHGYMFNGEPDYDTTFKLIRADNPSDKIAKLRQKITHLDSFGVTPAEFKKSIDDRISGKWEEIGPHEIAMAERILKGIYSSDDWISNGAQRREDCLSGGEILHVSDRLEIDDVN